MDAKITLSFDEKVIASGKRYAEESNISLSRLIEFMLKRVTTKEYASMEDFPIAGWVNQLAEGEAVYQTKRRSRKVSKDEFYKAKK